MEARSSLAGQIFFFLITTKFIRNKARRIMMFYSEICIQAAGRMLASSLIKLFYL